MSAIGDVVHGLPVVASLAKAWPGCRITWIIQPLPFELVGGHPAVSEYLLFDRHGGVAAYRSIRRLTRGKRFDVVLGIQTALKAGLITRLLDSRFKLGFDRARARDFNWLFTTHRIRTRRPQHVQDQYFEFLHHLQVPVVREWDFGITHTERDAQTAFFARIERPALAVVLRSSRPEKDWIPERYARVIEVAERDLGLQPVFVGSGAPAERAAAAEVARLARASPIDMLANDLRRLVWLLDGSAVVISPDSGPLHIATALGTPTIGLYGYTDPKRSGPYGCFGELVVDRYTRPGEHAPSPLTRVGNMERIEVAEVVEKLERAMREYVLARPGAARDTDMHARNREDG